MDFCQFLQSRISDTSGGPLFRKNLLLHAPTWKPDHSTIIQQLLERIPESNIVIGTHKNGETTRHHAHRIFYEARNLNDILFIDDLPMMAAMYLMVASDKGASKWFSDHKEGNLRWGCWEHMEDLPESFQFAGIVIATTTTSQLDKLEKYTGKTLLSRVATVDITTFADFSIPDLAEQETV